MNDLSVSNPDYVDAESRRYTDDAFFVLPLDSGKIAVLGPRRELYKIVDTWDEAKEVGPQAAPKHIQTYRPRPEKGNPLMMDRLNKLTDACNELIVNAEKVQVPMGDGLVEKWMVLPEDMEALMEIILGKQTEEMPDMQLEIPDREATAV